MNEFQRRWLKRASKYVGIPIAAGGVFGLLLAITLGAAPGSDLAPTIYLGLLATLVSAVMGISSSWAIAFWTDKIKRRRKAFLARLTFNRLRLLIIELDRNIVIGLAKGFDNFSVGAIFFLLGEAYSAASDPPDFDEVIDDTRDYEIAHTVLEAFRWAKWRLGIPEAVERGSDVEKREYLLENFSRRDSMLRRLQREIITLNKAEEHFAALRASH